MHKITSQHFQGGGWQVPPLANVYVYKFRAVSLRSANVQRTYRPTYFIS